MFNETELGQRIKELRKKEGLSLDKLSEKLGVYTRQTIAKWEKGVSSPDIAGLLRLCDVFGCDFGYLVGEYGCKRRQTADIASETGLSECAIENLRAAYAVQRGAQGERLNSVIVNSPETQLRDYEIGRFSKVLFISLLLENDDIWEKLSVFAYDFRKNMCDYSIEPYSTVKGISRDQFALVAKEAAKEMLSSLFDRINWDVSNDEIREAAQESPAPVWR